MVIDKNLRGILFLILLGTQSFALAQQADQMLSEPPQTLKTSSKPPAKHNRLSVGFELSPGGMQIPTSPRQEFGTTVGFQGMVLGRIKGTVSVFPEPPRGQETAIALDVRFSPYLEYGYINQNPNNPMVNPVGVGLEMGLAIFLDHHRLISITPLVGIGYSHLTLPESSHPFPAHYFQGLFGLELSFGLDQVSKIKGIDLYLAGRGTSLYPQLLSHPYGIGFQVPVGVRYHFY